VNVKVNIFWTTSGGLQKSERKGDANISSLPASLPPSTSTPLPLKLTLLSYFSGKVLHTPISVSDVPRLMIISDPNRVRLTPAIVEGLSPVPIMTDRRLGEEIPREEANRSFIDEPTRVEDITGGGDIS